MRRWSSATIRSFAASRSLSADPASAASWRRRAMKRASSAYGRRCRRSRRSEKRKCPDLIFVKPRFDVYKAVSQQIREIFAEHAPIIEPLSLDEAYLDVMENKHIPLARDVALAIRAEIKKVTGLNRLRRNILYNKFLAEARLRSSQAEQPVRHHARDGAAVR